MILTKMHSKLCYLEFPLDQIILQTQIFTLDVQGLVSKMLFKSRKCDDLYKLYKYILECICICILYMHVFRVLGVCKKHLKILLHLAKIEVKCVNIMSTMNTF